MALKGIERIVKGLRDVLKTNWDAELTTIEAEHVADDPIALPRPFDESWFLSQKRRIKEFPAVMVLGNQAVHGAQTGHAAYATQDEDGGHSISVVVVDRSDQEETLRLKLYRYARAVRQILADNYDLGGLVMVAKVEQEDFFPTVYVTGQKKFQQAVEINIIAQLEEAI